MQRYSGGMRRMAVETTRAAVSMLGVKRIVLLDGRMARDAARRGLCRSKFLEPDNKRRIAGLRVSPSSSVTGFAPTPSRIVALIQDRFEVRSFLKTPSLVFMASLASLIADVLGTIGGIRGL